MVHFSVPSCAALDHYVTMTKTLQKEASVSLSDKCDTFQGKADLFVQHLSAIKTLKLLYTHTGI